MTEPTRDEKIELIVKTIDLLATNRAQQQIYEMLGNASKAASKAEDSAECKQLLQKQLELML